MRRESVLVPALKLFYAIRKGLAAEIKFHCCFFISLSNWSELNSFNAVLVFTWQLIYTYNCFLYLNELFHPTFVGGMRLHGSFTILHGGTIDQMPGHPQHLH